jgi:phosphoribosyl 1,2-cyclic phosphodiesterase
VTKICVLASGSRGNAIYISNEKTAILVDAGLSGAELERRFSSRDIDPQSLDGIVVSHEHTDHIQGVGVLSRRFGIPVHMTGSTMRVAGGHLGPLYKARCFDCGRDFSIGSLCLRPFSVSHDAVDPAGFIIRDGSVQIGIATDLGIATQLVCYHLKGCRLLVLEANHDPGMLEKGPYPWEVKQRIRSRKGHLSNEACRSLLSKICHSRLEHVVVAHISETNNAPERALSVVQEGAGPCDIRFTLGCQHAAGAMVALDQDHDDLADL